LDISIPPCCRLYYDTIPNWQRPRNPNLEFAPIGESAHDQRSTTGTWRSEIMVLQCEHNVFFTDATLLHTHLNMMGEDEDH